MTRNLSHRGPDDEGLDRVSVAPGAAEAPLVVFGHRRLSILDLSAAGHQPMVDPGTDNWITYNGEIYNFMELRAELEHCGHRFVSRCDTEVILKAYAEWGTGCWRRLRGIFALGLWDERYRELHLVRDHLGVKPLYYATTPAGLAFASEVRALLAGEWVERKLSLEGMCSYLKYGSVQEPCSMVAGIASIPAGHYLTQDASGAATLRHYWRMEECIFRNWTTQPGPRDVLQQLEDSVRRQLISDVPVGVFLSGGLDSTAVAALAARAQPGAVQTFCIGLEDPLFDESAEAAHTAQLLGCKHTTLVLEGRTVRERWEQALASYDQPSVDGINTYFISLLVRQAGIKVALSGLGGDELFVGYSGFRKGLAFDFSGRLLRNIPPGIRHHAGRVLARLTPTGNSIAGSMTEILEPKLASPYFASRIHFSRAHIARFLGKPIPQLLGDSAWEKREESLAVTARMLAPVDRISFFELQTYMLSTLLRDSDQMSMAHGLELRVPLIDPELVEHTFPIPVSEKRAGKVGKRLLSDAVADIIPPEVMQRRKRGFSLPFRKWLSQDLQASVAERFLSIQPRGPWERGAYRKIWLDFGRGRVTWPRVLALLVLENWMEKNDISC